MIAKNLNSYRKNCELLENFVFRLFYIYIYQLLDFWKKKMGPQI